MDTSQEKFKVGQSWKYRAPEGFESSRMIVGALAAFNGTEPVVCASVTSAPRRLDDDNVETVTIPFLPMSQSAFAGSVVWLDGTAEPAPGFLEAFNGWQEDPRGLSLFTVPFEGSLDRMIALQMAKIVRDSAA